MFQIFGPTYRDGTSNLKGTSYETFSYTKPPHIDQPYLGGSLASQPQLSKKIEYQAHTRFLINAIGSQKMWNVKITSHKTTCSFIQPMSV
jgi:hypothetical protein